MKNNSVMLGIILSFFIVSGSMVTVFAFETEITDDRGIGCGDLHWGIKNFKNDAEGLNYFTRNFECNPIPDNSPYFENRDNVAVLHTEIVTPESNSFRWQAIMQGEDPFGHLDTDDGNAMTHNSNFPYDEIDENLRLRVQWVWSDNQTPTSSDDALKARFLTNLWFEHKTATDPRVLIVMDLLVDELITNSGNGNWMQVDSVNVDPDSPFENYSVQHCNLIDKPPGTDDELIYHFSVILNNATTTKEKFKEQATNIKDMISAAITYGGYDDRGGCENDPQPLGNIGDYQLVDIEQGIELNALPSTADDTGAIEGGYSFSELIVECPTPPSTGDWIISSSCAIPTSVSINGDVTVTNNSLLKILDHVTLDLNLGDGNSLTAESGSGIIIRSTAKIT